MVFDKRLIIKAFRLGGVIFLLMIIWWRFSSAQSVRFQDLFPSFLVHFFHFLREKLNLGLGRILPEPQLSFMKSFLFGGKNNLSWEWKRKIQKAGLSHLVAVSGLHLNIATQLLSLLLNACFVSNLGNFILSCLFILAFVVMADFSASVIRAALMTLFLLLARLTHRLSHSSFTLLLTFLIMLALDPLMINDLGFQLSFLATLGIIYLSPLFQTWSLWQNEIFQKQLHLLQEVFIVSLSSLVMVTPWVIYKTHFFPLLGFAANLLVVPLMPLIIILGIFGALMGLLLYPLGLFIGFFLSLLLTYILKIISFIASLSWAEILLPPFNLFFVSILYLILVAAIFHYRKTLLKIKKE